MSKKELVVLGLDEVKHERIIKTINKIRGFITNFDKTEELIPILEKDNEDVKRFIESQLELGDLGDSVRDFLQSELDEINTNKFEYIKKQKEHLELNRFRRDRIEEYLVTLSKYIVINEDGTIVEYTNSDVAEVLFGMIDTFDLDGKMAKESAKEISKEENK